MELMRPTCFASDNVCGMSKRGLERKKERTSLVIWIEVDVAVHDLVKESLCRVGGSPGSLESVCDDIFGRQSCRTAVRKRVRVAGHGERKVFVAVWLTSSNGSASCKSRTKRSSPSSVSSTTDATLPTEKKRNVSQTLSSSSSTMPLQTHR